MSEAREQFCFACDLVRERVFAEPVSNGYEVQTLACPKCKSVLKFVDERPHKSNGAGSSNWDWRKPK
jgi:hypothetical protein